MGMTEEQALDLTRQLLKAENDDELMRLVSLSLPVVDGTFFGVLEASALQLEREEKPQVAQALRSLGDRMLKLKTMI